MTSPTIPSRFLPWFAALLLTALAAGCAGNRAPILGLDGDTVLLTAPTVTAVAPVNNASGVPTNNTLITAAFSEPMAALTGSASFTLTAAAPAPAPTGTVTLDPTARIATFTLTPATNLTANTVYTATVTGATSLATGLALANPYVWHFTTGLDTSTTRPMVALTVPATTVPGPTLGVPTNTAITAIFTKDMNPATLTAASFTVTTGSGSPAGQVSYVVGSRTAVFTPAAALAASTTYTATLTTAATDLAGNSLAGNQGALPAASNYVWTFTTAAAADSTAPTILLTTPAAGAAAVALNSAVNATFSKAMNPQTITTATFQVRPTGAPADAFLAGTVFYDAATLVATFTPAAELAPGTSYTAAVTGAKDLAGNALAAGPVPIPWTFSTGSALAQGPVALGSAASFGLMATLTITNTGPSTVNGNVSLDPGTTLTGSPLVNGTVDVNDAASAQARIDLLTAFTAAQNLAPGTTIASGADLGTLYPLGIPPGTYTSAGTMLVATALTLNAGGDGNAVWIFQIGSSLTTTASVLLANGAQAKNVFWIPALDATLGSGTTFNGTLMAGRSITGNTGAVVDGRLLAGAVNASATVALQTNTISVPAQ